MSLPDIKVRSRAAATPSDPAKKTRRSPIKQALKKKAKKKVLSKAPMVMEFDSVKARVAECKRLMLYHLKGNHGNVAEACELTGISRMTHYRWNRSDADYAQAIDHINDDVVDKIENLFINTMVSEKELRSMRWFLERKGQHKGYGKPHVGQTFDEDGNPISGQPSIGLQQNINLNIRADLPGDSLAKALKDIATSNPLLIEGLMNRAAAAETMQLEGGAIDVRASERRATHVTAGQELSTDEDSEE
jgi:hypothetical protein